MNTQNDEKAAISLDEEQIYQALLSIRCDLPEDTRSFRAVGSAIKILREHAALVAVAEDSEKLRLTINALLTELPEKSQVNGEDNFPFRLKVLKIQFAAKKNIDLLANVRKGVE